MFTGNKVRVFIKLPSGTTKPLKIDTRISFEELQDQISKRISLQQEIKRLIASNGSVEWDIEEDSDVAELLAGDIITILT